MTPAMQAYVDELVDAAPPLSTPQRARLATLLRPLAWDSEAAA